MSIKEPLHMHKNALQRFFAVRICSPYHISRTWYMLLFYSIIQVQKAYKAKETQLLTLIQNF